MKKIEELKGASTKGIPMLEEVVKGLFELDEMFSILMEGGAEVKSVNLNVEKSVLGGICRMLEINSNAPTEDSPFWFIRLEANCGAELTLKAFANA